MEIEYFIHPDKLNECAYLEGEDLTLEINVLTATMQDKKQKEGKLFTFKDLVEKKVIGTKWHAYLVYLSYKWFLSIGIKNENLRIREHVKAELSHYSKETWDLEYNYPWGWKELSGVADRSDFDLKAHMVESKKDLTYFDEESKKKILPYVIEPSFGLERALLTLVLDAFDEKIEKTGEGENAKEEKKNILHLSPNISPIQVAIFPLMKKDGLAEKAKSVYQSLQGKFAAEYDEAGSIGKRYARHDEIGSPYCITIDYDTLTDDTVTIRDRDSTKQKRIKISDIEQNLTKLLNGSQFDSI
jgi:glycyl-tRNA synthetase